MNTVLAAYKMKPDDVTYTFAGGTGERGPVGAELKFHGYAGDYAQTKIDGENPRPELRTAIVMRVAGAQGFGLQVDEQKREAHGELRENVVEGDGEAEVEPIGVEGLFHGAVILTQRRGGDTTRDSIRSRSGTGSIR